MVILTIISILFIAIPVITMLGFFSYFEIPLTFENFSQSELISFFFMILKDITIWKFGIFILLIIFAFSIIKSWSNFLFYLVLIGILFYFYTLLYFTGYNAPIDNFKYQIYSGENCFYDNGFEKYVVLDLDSNKTKLIPINPDNSFKTGDFIVRDISSINCGFTKEELILIKNQL